MAMKIAAEANIIIKSNSSDNGEEKAAKLKRQYPRTARI
jgi:hypothetical protein